MAASGRRDRCRKCSGSLVLETKAAALDPTAMRRSSARLPPAGPIGRSSPRADPTHGGVMRLVRRPV
jgi:hypothetical protein